MLIETVTKGKHNFMIAHIQIGNQPSTFTIPHNKLTGDNIICNKQVKNDVFAQLRGAGV